MPICAPILALIYTYTYVYLHLHLRHPTLPLVLVIGLVGNSEIGLSKSGQVNLFRVLKRATTSLTSETLQTQELDDASYVSKNDGSEKHCHASQALAIITLANIEIWASRNTKSRCNQGINAAHIIVYKEMNARIITW